MNQHAAPPEFAMSFTQEAVLLEHRCGRDWKPLGQVRFAGREMTATLNALRDDAGGGSGAPDTVLVIPDDQILYTTLTVPMGTDTATVIGRALEAMTPYRAEDLAFDWCPSEQGDIETLRVAAVARRTLEEAEDFARMQGFRPASFVARPGDARFDGHPEFGPSRLATEQTAPQPVTEPDFDRARITAPVIDEMIDEVAGQAVADTPGAPVEPGAAPVISRIVPHRILAESVSRVASVAEKVGAAGAQNSSEVTQEETLPASTETAPAAATATPHAARSAPAVIRHGEQRAGPKAQPLSPRAEAVHNRAAAARTRRATEQAAPLAAATGLLTRLRAVNPGRLSVMMGVLVAGLVLVLALFGGGGTDQAPAERLAGNNAATEAPTGAIATGGAGDNPDDAIAAAQPPAETSAPDTPGAAADQAAVPTPAPAPAMPVEDAATAGAEAILDEVTDQVAVSAAPDPAETDPELAAAPEPPLAEQPQTEATAMTAAPPAGGTAAEAPSDPDGDALTRALAEAMATPDAAAPVAVSEAATREDAPRATASPVPSAATPSAAAGRTGLQRSARPVSATPTRTTAPAAPDPSPAVPANPLPFAQRGEAEPARVAGNRPPGRPASRPVAVPAAAAAAAPAPSPAAVPVQGAAQPAVSTARPPARPAARRDSMMLLDEGGAPRRGASPRLAHDEVRLLEALLRDLRTAQVGNGGLGRGEAQVLIRLADARPVRKPVAVAQPSQDAVRAAVAEAVNAAGRPVARDPATATPIASRPASASVGGRSARPLAKPRSAAARGGSDPGPGSPSLSGKAIDEAIAAAVANSTALPGAVALTALGTSALPPRRSPGAASPAPRTAAAAAPTPSAADLRAAAEAQQRDAGQAEQRRMDAELQAQAEARARAHAAADAQAEARARAQAEARARAQAEAEARAATARRQTYTPPEAESEPEVAAALPEVRNQGSAAANATVKDGIQLSRTQIIGTIGAGKASRALVRLSNGRVITLRLGDKINGGTITDISNSRITFVKGGRPQQLAVLNGQ